MREQVQITFTASSSGIVKAHRRPGRSPRLAAVTRLGHLNAWVMESRTDVGSRLAMLNILSIAAAVRISAGLHDVLVVFARQIGRWCRPAYAGADPADDAVDLATSVCVPDLRAGGSAGRLSAVPDCSTDRRNRTPFGSFVRSPRASAARRPDMPIAVRKPTGAAPAPRPAAAP